MPPYYAAPHEVPVQANLNSALSRRSSNEGPKSSPAGVYPDRGGHAWSPQGVGAEPRTCTRKPQTSKGFIYSWCWRDQACPPQTSASGPNPFLTVRKDPGFELLPHGEGLQLTGLYEQMPASCRDPPTLASGTDPTIPASNRVQCQ